MKLARMPHDAFVKRMFSDGRVAHDFFKHRLPSSLVERLQLSTLELQSSEFITAPLKKRVNDMLFRVRCLNPEGNMYIGGASTYSRSVAVVATAVLPCTIDRPISALEAQA